MCIRSRFRFACCRRHCDSQDDVALRGYVGGIHGHASPNDLVWSVDISDDCQTVMTFYATSLPSVVGSHFKAPDVVYLARQWLDALSMSRLGPSVTSSTLMSSTDVLRHAARLLFDAGIVKLSEEESAALVHAWQHHRQ